MDYYVSDGIYGSLNCIVYDHANPSISWLRDPSLPHIPEEEDKTVFRFVMHLLDPLAVVAMFLSQYWWSLLRSCSIVNKACIFLPSLS